MLRVLKRPWGPPLPLSLPLRCPSASPLPGAAAASSSAAASWASAWPAAGRKRARAASTRPPQTATAAAAAAAAAAGEGAPPPAPASPPLIFESEPSALAAALAAPAAAKGTDTVVLSALAGNAAICALKAAVWWRSGSPSMLAEALHSLVDTANQALLALGLRQSRAPPDARHHFGHGRAAFVWALLSAAGMLAVAGGLPIATGLHALLAAPQAAAAAGAAAEVAAAAAHPGEGLAVLAASLAIDGAVLRMALVELGARAAVEFPAAFAPGASLRTRVRALVAHARSSSDPFLAAVVLEDMAAVAGVLLAAAGVSAAHLLGAPAADAVASMAIGSMLAAVSVTLIRLNMRYLLGVSVSRQHTERITDIIRAFPSIDAVRYVHTQFLGPGTFLLSAKVDFDGTHLAAQLHGDYEQLFLSSPDLRDDLPLVLAYFAEDVTRVLEREVRAIEGAVRAAFPGAIIIQLEPDSKASEPDHFRGTLAALMTKAGRARAAQSESEEVAEVLEHHLRVLARRRQAAGSAEAGSASASLEAAERALRSWHARRLAAAQAAAAPQQAPPQSQQPLR